MDVPPRRQGGLCDDRSALLLPVFLASSPLLPSQDSTEQPTYESESTASKVVAVLSLIQQAPSIEAALSSRHNEDPILHLLHPPPMADPEDDARAVHLRAVHLDRRTRTLRHRATGPVPHETMAGRLPARLELVPERNHLRLRQLPAHLDAAAVVGLDHQVQRRDRRAVAVLAAGQGNHVHHARFPPAVIGAGARRAGGAVCGEYPCADGERYE